MGYFATFLICHLHFRHQFETFGSPVVDALWKLTVYAAIIVWAGSVCYSRLDLIVLTLYPAHVLTDTVLHTTRLTKFFGVQGLVCS